MGGGSTVIRRAHTQKSNVEITAALRTNFAHEQHEAYHKQMNGNADRTNGTHTKKHPRPPCDLWTTRGNATIYIPALKPVCESRLKENRDAYEITLKLFFLPRKPASCRCAQTRNAVNLVLRTLDIKSVDLLIASYPGMSFDADDEDEEPVDDLEDPNIEDVDAMIETWKCLEELHDEDVIKRIGLSEFGTQRLSRFLSKARIKPHVNQINVKDCCVVPKPLILFAKEHDIELLTHNDCTNILPSGTVRELLDQRETGAGVLAGPGQKDEGLEGAIEPQWVVKYTAVVKDRGVVESKGYFACAKLQRP